MEGWSRKAAAELNGMDRQTLSDWVHRYNVEGIGGLKSRKSPGRAPFLSEQQMAELRDLVLAGPDPAINKGVRWRCCNLRTEVARRWSVVPHRNVQPTVNQTYGKCWWLSAERSALSMVHMSPRIKSRPV